MAHDPKLNIYKIDLKPANKTQWKNFRWLFRNLIGEGNTKVLDESYIMLEVFRKFIAELDRPQMFADPGSKKCMTANQPNVEDDNVNTNIRLRSAEKIIEGTVEGGTFGRKRNKTATQNKVDKLQVSEGDAITEDFYFLIYAPFDSGRAILMVQSFSDDTIDTVMKKFWQKFLSFPSVFNQPKIERFVPQSIIDDIRSNSTISSLSFSTDVLGKSLLDDPVTERQHNFVVTVDIKPDGDDLSVKEYEGLIERIRKVVLGTLSLGKFKRQTGSLRDNATQRNSPFELASDYDIHPTIFLSKYVKLKGDEEDMEQIKMYCLKLLEEIKKEIYPQRGVEER